MRTFATFKVVITLLAVLVSDLLHQITALPASPYSIKSQELRLSETTPLNHTLPKNITPGSCCSCGLDPDPLHVEALEWVVEIPGQMMPSAQNTGGWGGGFLDNLRGQCGPITLWSAGLDGVPAPHTGIKTTFLTTIFCFPHKVQDAAWLASDPNNRVVLGCDWSY